MAALKFKILKTKFFNIIYQNGKAEKLIYKYLENNKKKSLWNKLISIYIKRKLEKNFHIIIGRNVSVGKQLTLPHPQNIVIGNYVKIGDNCKIFQDVTIGLKDQNFEDITHKYPIIKNNCCLYAGSKIIGSITLENGTIVGANSVLLTSTCENGVYVGMPAILKKINE
nr:hypothetical protein [uncultured Sellimonas sp.]